MWKLPDYMEGDVVKFGKFEVEWQIQIYFDDDGIPMYSWMYDTPDGRYQESEDMFESVEEAELDLGVA